MMEKQAPNDEREILAAAAALPSEDREAFLDAACGSRKEMRARIEGWLIKLDAGDFMVESAQAEPLNAEQAGERIGNYKLLEKIGEGGFGAVWVAEQERPVRRRVALKIIKLGMDTKEVIARFGQERQALALMDHPNIAKIFDAGATGRGRPYFVMELVSGTRITNYCDQANLPTADRLALFIQVCTAVQHAHQKGIIHRDLKPSNILVTLQDGVPVPKVIDFGVAKATAREPLADLTIYTRFEQMIGTPVYMSPEQAEMSGLDIDTRSDIYSLGVLLYELLTGRTPFDPAELMRKGYDEIRRAIREQEPQTPSTFLQTMADATRATVAQHRQSDPAKLMRLVRGDLDWIVMKSLEKDRTRRYETANGLAMDIQRHLANEPVLARPPTALYRLRRMVRRNRGAFAAAGAVTAALMIGLGMAVHSFLNERRALAGETTQRRIAEDGRRQAQASDLKSRQLLYAADIKLAQQAQQSNNLGHARQLLDRHRPADHETDLRGWEWRYLWQQCRSGALAMLGRHGAGAILSLGFSPDGAWLVAGYGDGHVELWDVANRKLAKLLHVPFDSWALATFSPRGDALAATFGAHEVRSYQVKTGAETTLCTLDGWVCDISYSRDGELLAVLTCDPSIVRVVRVSDGQPVIKFPLFGGGGPIYNNVRFSPDNQWLYISYSAWGNPRLRCMRVSDARLLWEIPIWRIENTDSGSDIGFTAIDLSPDGRCLAVATGPGDSLIRVLDAQTGQVVRKLAGHTGWASGLAFSKDGRVLASSSSDQTLRRWDTSTWTMLGEPLRGHGSQVHAVAFSDDGRFLASGSKDGEVLLWNASAPSPANVRRDLPPHLLTGATLPDSRHLLARNSAGEWSLVNLLTGGEDPLSESEAPRGRYFTHAFLRNSALSPDRKLWAVPGSDGQVGLYDPETELRIDILRSNMGSVNSVTFTPDNRRLVLATAGQGIELWDVTTRQELVTLPSRGVSLTALEFTEDGNTLFVGSSGGEKKGIGTCSFWRVPSWGEIGEAERAGRWAPAGDFQPPAEVTMTADRKNLLEQMSRNRLAKARAQSPEYSELRDNPLVSLAELFVSQRRFKEAVPLLREVLESRRRGIPQQDPWIMSAGLSLASVLTSLAEIELSEGDVAKRLDHIGEAGDLLSEQLALFAKHRPLHAPWDQDWVHDSASKLTDSLLSLAAAERMSGDHESAANHERQLDSLIPVTLELEAQMAVRSGSDRDKLLRAAARQAWWGREEDLTGITAFLVQQSEDKPEHPALAQCATKALCLRPSADPALLARMIPIARRAIDTVTHPWQRACYQQTHGIAEYRAGNYEAAEQLLLLAGGGEKAGPREKRMFVQCPTRFFRAMILARQGKEREARKLFAEAKALMKPLPAADRLCLKSDVTTDDLIVWLAYKEARALLQPEK